MAAPAPNAGWSLGLAALAWGAGVALQLRQPTLADQAWHLVALAGAVFIAGVLLARGRRGQERRGGWLAPLCLAVGLLAWGSTGWRAQLRLDERLAPELEGVDLMVTGVVSQMPQVGASGTRFRLIVESALHQGQPVRLPPQLSLGWYRGLHEDSLLAGPAMTLRAGQRWQLPLRLKLPHGNLNPHGFDAELWLFEQGVGAQGYVRTTLQGPAAQWLGSDVAHPVERLRQRLRDAIELRVSDPHAAGVLAALVVGDQAAIEREDWDLFRNTGVAHLMAISGLHITMLAWLAGAVVNALWRRSRRLAMAWPAPQAARWGGLVGAAAYALLAGWGVPAQRTVLMLLCVTVLRSAGLRWPPTLVLGVAGAVVSALDPWALLQPGFWLSFAAVGLLMVSEPQQAGGRGADLAAWPLASGARRGPVPGPVDTPALAAWRRYAQGQVHGHLRAQVVATLGLAPLAMLFFHQVSLVGFVANLLVIPLVTLVITPLALAGALVPGLWGLAGLMVQGLILLLQALAAWPIAVWTAAAAPGWGVAAGLLGALLLVLPLPGRVRALGLPLLMTLLWPAGPRPAPGSFELVAVDVGQGTAALVRTREHLLVFDAGPQYSRDSDAGQRLLLPLLRARGERRIDMLVASHRDSDHVGGAAALLGALPVAQLRHSLPADHPLLARPEPAQRCQAGQRWQWDGVDFEVLHPPAAPEEGAGVPAPGRSNSLSCVLRVQDSVGRAALLTADIEAAQEAELVARLGARLSSQVLMVPHHGSRTSSTPAWLDTVQPRLAFVQAGYRSRFGHPAPEVLARYDSRGIKVVRSDRCGAWTWRDGASHCLRDDQPRHWRWTLPDQAPAPAAAPSAGADVAKPLPAGETSR